MLVVNEVQVSVMIEDLGMVDVLLRVVKKKEDVSYFLRDTSSNGCRFLSDPLI